MKKLFIVLIATFFIVSCSKDARVYRVAQADGSVDFLETEKTFRPGDSVEVFITGLVPRRVLIKGETLKSLGVPAMVTVLSEETLGDTVKTYPVKQISTGVVYEVESLFELCSGDEMFVKRTYAGSTVIMQSNAAIAGLMKVRVL